MSRHSWAPARYELRVGGHLDDRWSASFGDAILRREPDGSTVLCGTVRDQAELHGLLGKVRDLGVTLISVEVIDGPDHKGGIEAPADPYLPKARIGGPRPVPVASPLENDRSRDS